MSTARSLPCQTMSTNEGDLRGRNENLLKPGYLSSKNLITASKRKDCSGVILTERSGNS